MAFRKNRVTPLNVIQKNNGLPSQKISSLQYTFTILQFINLFAFPFPVQWIKEYQKYKISHPLLKLYWVCIVYKLAHITFLTTMAFLSLYSDQCQCDRISLPVIFTNVAALIISLLVDVTFILTAKEVVNSFNWSYQMLNNHLTNKTIGKHKLPQLAGYCFMVLTLGITIMALTATSFVGYFQYDTFQILIGCLISSRLSQSKIVRFISFGLLFHEGQMIVMIIRMYCLWLFHEAIVRVYIMFGLLERCLSLFRVKIYQEIRIVTRWLHVAESVLVGLVLTFVFLFILFSACTLFVGVKRNNITIAVPALGVTCIGVVILQIIFIFGCAFFNISKSVLVKWKRDAKLYNQKDVTRTRMCKIINSLNVISVPAGNVGIIDKDIKINYMDNLLQNIVSSVLTLKDLLQ